MNAIESTGVAVLGLNSNCVELVLRSVGNQHVSTWSSTIIPSTDGSMFFFIILNDILMVVY